MLMQVNNAGDTILKFGTLDMAFRFKYHNAISKAIVIGDDDMFWLVTPNHAERLVSQGYEMAE